MVDDVPKKLWNEWLHSHRMRRCDDMALKFGGLEYQILKFWNITKSEMSNVKFYYI